MGLVGRDRGRNFVIFLKCSRSWYHHCHRGPECVRIRIRYVRLGRFFPDGRVRA